VNFLQNHDQIGNRALGDRLDAVAEEAAVMAALAVLLLAPMPPLMFMGEDWGATEPFPFFCDFSGALADAVRRGRREEFAEAYADPDIEVSDPLSEQTFRSAVLDWTARERPPHRQRLAFVRALLQARREHVVPRLVGLTNADAAAEFTGDLLHARWRLADGASLHLLANLSANEHDRPPDTDIGMPIWGGTPAASLPPWTVHWGIGGT
jgi:maltooligosyltrehalose trehalohydrolase